MTLLTERELDADADACPAPPAMPTLDLPGLLQFAVDEACRLLAVDVAFIYLVDEDGRTAHWAFDSGIDDEQAKADVRGWQVPLDKGIVGLAISSRQLQQTDDWVHDERFFDAGYRNARSATLHLTSVIAAPMIGQLGALGALGVFDRTRRVFSEPELALVRALAGHAAFAIENARLNTALLDSQSRLEYLLQHSVDGIWSADPGGRFTWISDSIVGLVGWCPAELVGQTAETVLDEDSWRVAQEKAAELAVNPSLQQLFRVTLRHRDGRRLRAEIKQTAIVTDGRYAGTHGSIRDITERDALERELRAQAAELATGRERARLAQELHDSVTQALFGMTLTTRSAEMLLERDRDAVRGKLTELRELARDALAEMRALIFELRPGSLAEEGLGEAIRKHVAAVRGRTGLAVEVDIGPVPRLPLEIEDGLYRITQEALHNVVKHAAAHTARVRLQCAGSAVVLEIADDGIGFEPAAVGSGHLGLAGIRTRADVMKANVEVASAPGNGTTIRVTLDVARAGPGAPPGQLT